jgi:hypothetical protein
MVDNFTIEKGELKNWDIASKINNSPESEAMFKYNAILAPVMARHFFAGKMEYKAIYNKIYNAAKSLPGKEPKLDPVYPFGSDHLFIKNNEKLGEFLKQFIKP